MSRQVQWNRPTEYDPALAEQAAQQQYFTKDALKNDLGFESDSDNNSSGDEYGASPNGKSARKKKPTYVDSEEEEDDPDVLEAEIRAQQEIDRMAEQLQQAIEGKLRAEENLKRSEERLDEFQRMSKQAKSILVNKFRQQLKLLMQQVEEQKTMLQEDDVTLEQLKEANLKYEQGDKATAEEIQSKLKEFKDSRTLTRENTTLKYKLEELATAAKQQKEELEEKQKENEILSSKLHAVLPDSGEDIVSLKTRVDKLELERNMLREELKKKHLEKTQLQQQVDKLQKQGGDSAVASSSNSATSVNASSSATNGTSPAVGAVSGISAAKVQEYETRIRTLEDELRKCQAELQASKTNLSNVQTQLTAAQAQVAASTAAASAAAAAAGEKNGQADAQTLAQLHKVLAEKAAVDTALANSTKEKTDLQDVIKKMDELIKRKDDEMKDVKEKAKEKLTTASNAIKKLKTEYANLRTAYAKARGDGSANESVLRTTIQNSIVKRREVLGKMSENLKQTRHSLAAIREDVSKLSGPAHPPGQGHNQHHGTADSFTSVVPAINQAIHRFIESRKNETAHLHNALKKEMQLRKQYFNTIQELKGNIRVYCRVRPMHDREASDKENQGIVTFPNEGELLIQNVEKKTAHTFEFEKVFNTNTTQSEVFSEVSDLVLSVLDGFNTCIFAYGQTGSGKTHTMQGPKEDPGVNIRALTKLFSAAAERAPDITYEISMTLLEIYNEKIQDLLTDKADRVTLKAVQGQYGMEVQDLTMIRVNNEKEVLDTLKKGSKNRSVTATQMNDVSSRSHLILSVYVLAKNSITGKDTMGKLHLIDLAGSERVGRSGVTGEALKEAQSINSSLSALGNVIAARANKSAHVPYRDSTLTYLLQDSLEKNSKTLMFVQVSPTRADSSESICSLRFAERVRKVELGKAQAVVAKK